MTLSKDIKLEVVKLRVINTKTWTEVTKIICDKFKLPFNKKMINRIRKAGQREMSLQNVEDGVFTVEEIRDRRTRNGSSQYLVKWVGSDELTWEDERNVTLTEEMRQFVVEFNDYLL